MEGKILGIPLVLIGLVGAITVLNVAGTALIVGGVNSHLNRMNTGLFNQVKVIYITPMPIVKATPSATLSPTQPVKQQFTWPTFTPVPLK